MFEPLEDRRLLALVAWDGGGGNFDWNTAANWTGDEKPRSNDDVVIDFGANDFTVTLTGGTTSVRSVTAMAGLNITGTLEVAAASRLAGPLSLGGTLGGAGDLVIQGSTSLGGTVAGPVGSKVTFEGSVSFANVSFRERDVIFSPTADVTWDAGVWGGDVNLYGDVLIENQGTWRIVVPTGRAYTLYAPQANDPLPRINNTGLIVVSGNGQYTYLGARIDNSGSIDVQGGLVYLGKPQGQGSVLSGSLSGANGGTSWFYGDWDVSGTVNTAGAVKFNGVAATTVSGSYSAGNTTVLTGTVQFSGSDPRTGHLQVNGTADFSPVGGAETLVLPSLTLGGTLTGTDEFIVAGSASVGGTIAGPAGSKVTFEGPVNFASVSFRERDVVFAPNSEVTWDTGVWDGGVLLYGDVLIENQGIWRIVVPNGRTYSLYAPQPNDPLPRLINTGSIVAVVNGQYAYLGARIDNAGTIDIQSGLLYLGVPQTQGNVLSGSLIGASGGTASLRGQWEVSGDVNSDGAVKFDTSAANVTGDYQAAQTIISGTATFDMPTPTFGDLILQGGTFVSDRTVTVNGVFSWGGTLKGEGNLAASSTIINGGNLAAGFDYLNPAGALATWFGGIGIDNGSVFENAGTLELRTDAGIGGGSASVFRNTGTLRKVGGNPAPNLFYGSLMNSAGLFTNSGTVDLQVGTMSFGGYTGGLAQNFGTVTSSAGTTLWFLGALEDSAASVIDADYARFHVANATISGSYRANRTELFESSSTVRITGRIGQLGDVLIGAGGSPGANPLYGGGTLDLTGATFAPGATTLSTLTLFGPYGYVGNANLIASADLTVRGVFRAASGSIRGVNGQGSLRADGGSIIEGGGTLSFQNGMDFVNPTDTYIDWKGGSIALNEGSTFDNQGTIDLRADGSLQGGATSTFLNSGTFRKLGGNPARYLEYGSMLSVGGGVINSGTIDVQVGTLLLGHPQSVTQNTGTLQGAAGTSFWLNERLNSTGTIDADFVRFHGADANITGTYRSNHTELRTNSSTVRIPGTIEQLGDVVVGVGGGGTLDLTGATFAPGATTLPNLTIYSPHPTVTARLITDAAISVAGTFVWNQATLQSMAGTGSLTLANPLTVNAVLNARDFQIVNSSDMLWSSGTIAFYGPHAGFTNATGATFKTNFDGTFGSADGNCVRFVNDGHFVKTGGSGITYLQMQLYNRSTVEIQQGHLYLGCGYVTTPGNPVPPGITYPSSQPPSYEDPGSTPLPPEQPVVVPGNYTQTVTGVLIEKIAGHTGPGTYGIPGTDYGQLVVTGNVALNGSLEVQVIGGFVPTFGQQFLIIDNRGSRPIEGTFIGLSEGATIWAGSHSFSVSYVGGDGNDLVLTASRIAEIDLSGLVFDDRDNNGLFNGDDAAIADVRLELINSSGQIVATALTDPFGRYAFNGTFAAGLYRIVQQQPAGFLDGKETAGNLGGTVDNSVDSNEISQIPLNPGAVGVDYLFAEIRPSRLQGLVWEDLNNDGEVNFGERAIAGVDVRLTGTDDRGRAVDLLMATDDQGIFEFLDLRPGNYTLMETQPAGFPDGKESLGTVNGVPTGNAAVDDQFSDIVLPVPDSQGANYNFGERPISGGALTSGQTASIGFWQNKNGQALIQSLNGGATSTQLGDWLAATFPNMYGTPAAGNNLAGKTNAQIAAFYVSLFKRTAKESAGGPPKLDAQVLAASLAVYVTNQQLAGNTAASYGFRVTSSGVGTATVNVGNKGAAFGVANDTAHAVLDLLLATNSRTTNGLLYDLDGSGTISSLEKDLRTLANDLFALINELGGL